MKKQLIFAGMAILCLSACSDGDTIAIATAYGPEPCKNSVATIDYFVLSPLICIFARRNNGYLKIQHLWVRQ